MLKARKGVINFIQITDMKIMYILRKLCIHVETRRPCNFYLESSVSGLIRTVIDDSSSNGLFSSIQLELSDFLILFNLFSFTVCVFFRKKSFDFLCEFILFGEVCREPSPRAHRPQPLLL